MRRTLVLCLTLLAATACKRKEGPTGPEGPQGPAGPVGDPPRILSVSPAWGSSNSVVTITGESFVDGATNNLVYFDGVLADVSSATTTELVVQPTALDTSLDKIVDITVITANQASNAFAWEAVPSGTARTDIPLDYAFIWEPTDFAMGPNENTLYVADARSGVLAVDRATGTTTRVRAIEPGVLDRPLAISYNPNSGTLWVADDATLAADASAVRLVEVDPANGDTQLLIAATPDLSEAVDMVSASDGLTYILRDRPTGITERVAAVLGDVSVFTGLFASMPADSNPRQLALDEDTNELHITSLGADDLYTVDAPGGGAATAEGLTLANPIGIVVSGTDEVQVIQGGGASGIKTVDLATAMVSDYNTFTYPLSFSDTVALETTAGGELSWVGYASSNIDMPVIVESSAADSYQGLTAGLTSGFATLLEYNGAIYWDSIVCNAAQAPAEMGMLMRANPDGSTEVAARGSCGIGLSASADTIFTTNLFDSEALAIDPTNGNVTTILDASDGLDEPDGTIVEGNNLFVIDGGAAVVMRSDFSGGNLDASFATGMAGFVGTASNGTAYIADFVIGGVTTFDTTNGGALASLTGPGLGGMYDVELLPNGNVLALSNETGSIVEVAPDGSITPLRSSGQDGLLPAPSGVQRLPDGSYLVIDTADPLGEIGIVAP